MYEVKYTDIALKALKKLDRHTAMLITAWVRKNLDGCTDARAHGKALTANHRDKWRYRVGDYRLLAEISDNTVTILILTVGHRREVYESRR